MIKQDRVVAVVEVMLVWFLLSVFRLELELILLVVLEFPHASQGALALNQLRGECPLKEKHQQQ